MNFAVKRYNLAHKLLPVIFTILIINNIYVFKNLAGFNKPIDQLKISFNQDIKVRSQYAILSEFPYEYKKHLQKLKSRICGKYFVAGVTYGVFGEILNNFTVSEVKSERDIYKEIPSDFFSENINKNNKIQLVLISDFYGGDKLKTIWKI